ncbi:MAG: uracil-DNA glycosylase [Solirubrobacteraceae bacterium]
MSHAGQAAALERLECQVVDCRRCSRLVSWREEVARTRRASFADQEYWGRPLPGFGDPKARILVVGLAPAAHGGNRTGRIFTGDRSGDWLFASLWRVGLANQPQSVARDDGLSLRGCWISAVVRCAPPANRPLPSERDNCLPYLVAELALLTEVSVLVCLGGFAWDGALRALGRHDATIPKPRPRFAHAGRASVGRWTLIGCYHPSQQNTFTGRLTEPMIDEVFKHASEVAGLDRL